METSQTSHSLINESKNSPPNKSVDSVTSSQNAFDANLHRYSYLQERGEKSLLDPAKHPKKIKDHKECEKQKKKQQDPQSKPDELPDQQQNYDHHKKNRP
jgi:hypothetical protein